MLGIELMDFQCRQHAAACAPIQYGNFIPDANGFPQVVMAAAADLASKATADSPMAVSAMLDRRPGPTFRHLAVRTGHAFLADIAHNAVPDGSSPTATSRSGWAIQRRRPSRSYDNELLDAHFVAGDGRANENIGLTAVHHVFHSEHNRLVEHTKDVVLADAAAMLAGGATQAEAVAFLNEWLVDDVATVPAGAAIAPRLGRRTPVPGRQVRHRDAVPASRVRGIRAQDPAQHQRVPGPDGFDVTIDPSIVAEFAHVVYRFGHSMLTEFDRSLRPELQRRPHRPDRGLPQSDPVPNNGTDAAVDADIAAGAIIRGMTRQVGNEIDEFVTSALRNNLLGLPLDLATINLARGRDTGVPSLNEARRQFYEATNQDVLLKPYESWVDFAGHLKHEASIINFIAAYGTHA